MGHDLEGESMRYEELTTPEAVLAAFEAGRRVERTANDGRNWISTALSAERDVAGYIRIGWRYRALIEEPEASADPFGSAASDALNHPSGMGIVRVDCDGASQISVERVSPDEVLAPAADPESERMQRDRNDADALVAAMDRTIARSSLEVRKACAPPVPDGYTPWYGGECPDDAVAVIPDLIFRNGQRSRAPVIGRHRDWEHRGFEDDIIAYRVESEPKPAPSDVEARAIVDACAKVIREAGRHTRGAHETPHDLAGLIEVARRDLDEARARATALERMLGQAESDLISARAEAERLRKDADRFVWQVSAWLKPQSENHRQILGAYRTGDIDVVGSAIDAALLADRGGEK